MPGYIMHLTEAELVIDLLKNMEDTTGIISEEWEDLFRCGNLLPDAVPGSQKQYSHFWDDSDMDNIIIKPCIRKFLNKYKIDINQPLLVGYFVHLYLDEVFYGKYIRKCISFFDENGNLEEMKSKIVFARITGKEDKISISQFFSEEYLYGDYTKLNDYLMNRYNIHIPYKRFLGEIPVKEAVLWNLEGVFHELKTYREKGIGQSNELKIFSKESISEFLEHTAFEIKRLITA